MHPYNIFVDELKSSSSFQIALIPANRGGATATKRYTTKETFAGDLQEYLGYTDGAVAQFFASADNHQTLVQHWLSDVAAAHLGWLPSFN